MHNEQFNYSKSLCERRRGTLAGAACTYLIVKNKICKVCCKIIIKLSIYEKYGVKNGSKRV